MKCPKCNKELDIIKDKKFGGTYAGHLYSLDAILKAKSMPCDYSKRLSK